MNTVDLLILLWVVSAVLRGYHIGFLRQALSFAGFCVGLLLGSWLSTMLVARVGGGSRLLLTLLCTLGLGAALASLGELAAVRLQDKVQRRLAHVFNAWSGVALSVVATLIMSWLLASALIRLPLANIGLGISDSKILAFVDRVMPPAPTVMNRLGRLISPHGFPQVFVDNEPVVDPAGPPATPEVEAAAAKAKDAMVKVEGYACGGVSVGSGFVAGQGFVATNAHVIAGVREPIIIHGGSRYRAVPVWFNPSLDFAVLRVEDLGAAPLPLTNSHAPRGTSGAVLGYPGGGQLTIDPAVIAGVRRALGRDIYDRNLAMREIYEVQADIEQGNSGGPLVLPDGSVAGVMFGESVANNGASYAITSLEVADDLEAAITENSRRSTGPCM